MGDTENKLRDNFESDQQRMLANIVFTGNWVRSNQDRIIDPHGISSQQFRILKILSEKEEAATMSEIKKDMLDKSPHLTRMVTKLLDKELVERKPNPKDRRIIQVSLTKSGLNLVRELEAEIEYMQNYIDRVTPWEAQTVNAILEKLRK